MSRVPWLLVFTLVILPRPSIAIDLRWSSGASDRAFASATRCTLLLRADRTEGVLPPGRHLQWVASGCEIRPVPLAPGSPCQSNLREVSRVIYPTDAAQIEEHVLVAELCGASIPAASVVQYVFDLPAGSRGKFKVVALDPTDPDSSRVLVSPVVTFNAGVEEPFPPVILRTKTHHHSTEFRLTGVGALSEARAMELVAPDGSWRLALETLTRSETSIVATASIAAHVPACLVEASTEGHGIAVASVPSDPPPPPLQPRVVLDPEGSSCQETFREGLPGYPLGMIQPKDFAFVLGGWTPSGSWVFHLFYIRQNQETKLHHGGIDFTEKNIGHAKSNDLLVWPTAEIDTAAIQVRPNHFDSKHVWAPSIVQRGLTYYMFYTGVDDLADQRMGLATSTDLETWTQLENPNLQLLTARTVGRSQATWPAV